MSANCKRVVSLVVDYLFAVAVKRCSELFLVDLEKRWQESALITTLADIVLTHASSTFSVYVKYCSNQIYQDRMLKELK